ncbi:hypothetical protein J4471_04835 [Candidatus Woesearchaeota archaeon]|nr:hypothetical protein [Candidatus Woesearchaeota archaeon]
MAIDRNQWSNSVESKYELEDKIEVKYYRHGYIHRLRCRYGGIVVDEENKPTGILVLMDLGDKENLIGRQIYLEELISHKKL